MKFFDWLGENWIAVAVILCLLVLGLTAVLAALFPGPATVTVIFPAGG